MRKKPVLQRKHRQFLLSDEQNTQGSGTTVAGNGAAGSGFINGVKMTVLVDGVLDSGQAFVGNGGICQEQFIPDDVLPISQTILNIGSEALGIIATILLHNAHLTVTNLNAGF